MAKKVTAPQRQPRVGGIKSVVSFTDEPRLGHEKELAWEGSDCGFPHTTRAGCTDEIVAAADKEFDGSFQFSTIVAPFAQYKGVQCFLGGDEDGPSYEEQAKAALELAEDREIEAKLWAWVEDATDAATSVDLVAALAAVEQEADADYVGAPLILMSRADAVQLKAKGVLEIRENGTLHTASGNRVLASSSFAVGAVGAVGWPAVYASPVLSGRAPHHTQNLDMALAERVYTIGVDCEYRIIRTTA